MALSKINIKNYRSFKDAEVSLRPFTLIIGANGSGKSNFLRALRALFSDEVIEDKRHLNLTETSTEITTPECTPISEHSGVGIFRLDAEKITRPEELTNHPTVKADGSGTTQTLEALKNGDREDLFNRVEDTLRTYIPEIEKISFRTEHNKKAIQVRERGVERVISGNLLSEGTRLVIAILTILHQTDRPPLILLEDIDHGLHPRLYEKLVGMMRQIAQDEDVQIIATTHNPYLLDQFEDDPEAVVIVEKNDGFSSLTTLKERLEILGNDESDTGPLGELWYSGLVGGIATAKKV